MCRGQREEDSDWPDLFAAVEEKSVAIDFRRLQTPTSIATSVADE